MNRRPSDTKFLCLQLGIVGRWCGTSHCPQSATVRTLPNMPAKQTGKLCVSVIGERCSCALCEQQLCFATRIGHANHQPIADAFCPAELYLAEARNVQGDASAEQTFYVRVRVGVNKVCVLLDCRRFFWSGNMQAIPRCMDHQKSISCHRLVPMHCHFLRTGNTVQSRTI
jgi:hypothetical protein